MKILILTVGTRGDVQPYLAVGIGLQTAGHQVMICAPATFKDFVTDYGLDFHPMPNDILDLLESQAGRQAVEDTRGVFGALRSTLKLMGRVKPIQRGIMQACWAAAQDFAPDGLIFHSKTLCGTHIAEKLQIPVIMSLPLPAMIPTAAFPLMGMATLPAFIPAFIRGRYHRSTYGLVQLGMKAYSKLIQTFRQETLGLAPQDRQIDFLHQSNGQPLPFLHLYSTAVLPRPADWPETVGVTGYTFLPTQPWSAPAELAEFLARGPAPVYIGFGSIGGKDPQSTARKVLAAIEIAQVRAVIATGWGGLAFGDRLPDNVYVIESAPHDQLFPQMAAVVHHGGAGSTAAGLRAGKPTLICPFFGDQPFWGARLLALGVGPAPLPQKQISSAALGQRLRQLTQNNTYAAKAEALGRKIQAEDGLAQAIAFIERYLNA